MQLCMIQSNPEKQGTWRNYLVATKILLSAIVFGEIFVKRRNANFFVSLEGARERILLGCRYHLLTKSAIT